MSKLMALGGLAQYELPLEWLGTLTYCDSTRSYSTVLSLLTCVYVLNGRTGQEAKKRQTVAVFSDSDWRCRLLAFLIAMYILSPFHDTPPAGNAFCIWIWTRLINIEMGFRLAYSWRLFEVAQFTVCCLSRSPAQIDCMTTGSYQSL